MNKINNNVEDIKNCDFTQENHLKQIEKGKIMVTNVNYDIETERVFKSNPNNQVMLIVDGEGLYKEKGKKERRVRKGDILHINKNVMHILGSKNKKLQGILIDISFKNDEPVLQN